MFTFASTFHKAFMKDTSCGSSSVGRALASQAKGHEFESRLPLIKKKAVLIRFSLKISLLHKEKVIDLKRFITFLFCYF